MSYQTLDGTALDPQRAGPEKQQMRQMDKAMLPYPDPVEIKQVPTGGPEPDPNISAQVGGILGPSDQEKKNAAQILGMALTTYANSLLIQQYCNKQLREFSALALASGKQLTDPDVKELLDGFRQQAELASGRLKEIKSLLDEYSKKDPEIWDKLQAQITKLQTQAAAGNITVPGPITDKNGVKVLEFQAKTLTTAPAGTGSQVGIAPVVIIVVVIVAVSILAASVSMMLNAQAKVIAEKRKSDSAERAFASLVASRENMVKAWEDLKAGKITKEQYALIAQDEQKFQANIQKAQAEASKETGGKFDWKPVALVVGLGALGVIAYKKGWIQQSLAALQDGPFAIMVKKPA